MDKTTLEIFTHAAQQAQQWVNELADELNWTERRANRLLRSVLHTLRLAPAGGNGRSVSAVAIAYSRRLFRRLEAK
jgi:uncharacterized protein (DUF2267 family)